MTGRDYQRARIYAWEDRLIAPCDKTKIAFRDAQAMVDAIWADQGLLYPPEITPLPRQSRTRLADASRLTIRLPAQTPAWCLLHEIAHAMTSTHDGQSDGHGPVFVGLYAQLLERYLRRDPTWLHRTLAEAGIDITIGARPVFLT